MIVVSVHYNISIIESAGHRYLKLVSLSPCCLCSGWWYLFGPVMLMQQRIMGCLTEAEKQSEQFWLVFMGNENKTFNICKKFIDCLSPKFSYECVLKICDISRFYFIHF